ncbi:hypothetical protein BT047_RS21925 [Vibrio parahaemolyticus]|nr:hypothetical protein [Vibrio parahaemolyticus]EHR1263729.1 hypothetical protein [Vibrio parahaemolyticus]EJG1655601.1 hypothetical protein [Vibrio parahaemolyticus]EKB1982609.1 hypothetical protein [Vibrio parahaemolyticus]EME0849513.1 hypothetical protein [Vibrio parahaemolyticus]
MSLYKFVERQFLDSFFTSGCLRLGTLYDFKDTVEHGESRGDKSEGEHQLIRSIDGTVTLTKDKHEPIVSEVFKMVGEGESYISNLSIVVPRRSPDGFVFCTSKLYTEELFWKWNSENGVDACYEITNPRRFIEEITKAISNSAFFFGNANVTYTDDPIPYDSPQANVHPAFTKETNGYRWQEENRSIWGARGPCGQLMPWIIFAPEARQYCRPFSVIDKADIRYINV